MDGVGAGLARGAHVLGRVEIRRDLDDRVRRLARGASRGRRAPRPRPSRCPPRGRRGRCAARSRPGWRRAGGASGRSLGGASRRSGGSVDRLYLLRLTGTGGGRSIVVRLRWVALCSLCGLRDRGHGARGTTLIVTGHGWGHGVGMSQWGAYGYALHGWEYRRILVHYYPGTTMGHVGERTSASCSRRARRVVTVGCAAPLVVTDGRRLTRTARRPKTYGVGSRLVLPRARTAQASPSRAGVAVFSCARAPLTLDGREYRGTLVLRQQGGKTSRSSTASHLTTYVRGVVPSESPSHWPLAALEAQAVAARSYAVAQLRPSSWYDLVPDTRRPGLRRGRGRAAAHRPRGRRDARPDPDVRRRGRADVLLLELRRPHRVRAGRVARLGADPVPPLGAGSVRHVLAAPRLGAVRPTPAERLAARLGLGSVGRVGARGARREPARRVGRVPPGVRCRGDAQRSRR